jgi:adenylate cyclase
LAEARRVEAPNVVYGHVAVAAAAARLGRRDEAAAAVAAILAVDPAYGEHAVADLESRSLAPPLIRAVVAGLEDAGLSCRAGKASDGLLPIYSELPRPARA